VTTPARTFIRKIFLLALPMYLLSLLLTWPATGLLGRALERFSGSSAFPEQLVQGRIGLFLGEFAAHSLPALGGLPAIFVPLVPVYILLWILAAAGITAAFAAPEDRTLVAFGAGVFRLGPRFLLLFLVMLPVYALLAGICSLPALLLSLTLSGNSELAPFGFGVLGACLAGLGLVVGQIFHLSAKAAIALRPGPFWRSLLGPFSFGGPFWRRMFLVYLAVLIGGAAAVALLSAAAFQAGPVRLLAGLLWQAGVFLHVAARVTLHGLFVGAVRRRLGPLTLPAAGTVASEAQVETELRPSVSDAVLPASNVILLEGADPAGSTSPSEGTESNTGQTTPPAGS
jgi:hypothetical protein